VDYSIIISKRQLPANPSEDCGALVEVHTCADGDEVSPFCFGICRSPGSSSAFWNGYAKVAGCRVDSTPKFISAKLVAWWSRSVWFPSA
jgi:hypothetical protein